MSHTTEQALAELSKAIAIINERVEAGQHDTPFFLCSPALQTDNADCMTIISSHFGQDRHLTMIKVLVNVMARNGDIHNPHEFLDEIRGAMVQGAMHALMELVEDPRGGIN